MPGTEQTRVLIPNPDQRYISVTRKLIDVKPSEKSNSESTVKAGSGSFSPFSPSNPSSPTNTLTNSPSGPGQNTPGGDMFDDDDDDSRPLFGGQISLLPSSGMNIFTIFSLCIIAGLHDIVAGIFIPGR